MSAGSTWRKEKKILLMLCDVCETASLNQAMIT